MAGVAVLILLAPINGGILVSFYTKYQVSKKNDNTSNKYTPYNVFCCKMN